MAIIKRKRYIIKKAFQARYIGVTLLFILLGACTSFLITCISIYPYFSEKLAGVYTQGRLITVLRAANIKIAVALAIILPIAAWLGIILSHKIAGPWYRFELILRDLAEGDLTTEVRLRKNDELQSLADGINTLIRKLRTQSQSAAGHLESLEEMFKNFEDEFNRQPIDMIKIRLLISKMYDIRKELGSLLDKAAQK